MCNFQKMDEKAFVLKYTDALEILDCGDQYEPFGFWDDVETIVDGLLELMDGSARQEFNEETGAFTYFVDQEKYAEPSIIYELSREIKG